MAICSGGSEPWGHRARRVSPVEPTLPRSALGSAPARTRCGGCARSGRTGPRRCAPPLTHPTTTRPRPDDRPHDRHADSAAATVRAAHRLQPSPSTRRLAVVGTDAVALVLALALVPEMDWVHLGAVTTAVLLFLATSGSYRPRLSLSVFDDVASLTGRRAGGRHGHGARLRDHRSARGGGPGHRGRRGRRRPAADRPLPHLRRDPPAAAPRHRRSPCPGARHRPARARAGRERPGAPGVRTAAGGLPDRPDRHRTAAAAGARARPLRRPADGRARAGGSRRCSWRFRTPRSSSAPRTRTPSSATRSRPATGCGARSCTCPGSTRCTSAPARWTSCGASRWCAPIAGPGVAPRGGSSASSTS